MKTILVTGGAGFIGSNLCDRLLKNGDRVVCVDNFLTSTRENIKNFFDNNNFRYIEHDIINPLFIEESIDEIFNLACPASPLHYQNNAIRTIKANTIGVINMLGLAREKNAKILQASTSEIYGNPLQHPQKESYYGNINPIGPRACYDEGKRCSESLFFDYLRTHNLKIKVVRIFNTYGPNMALNDGRVISNFIVRSLNGDDLIIYGDGSQTRSFCYVDDLVDGLIKMMNSNDKIYGPINIGNPEELTVKEVAQKIIKLTNSKSRILYTDLPVDDPAKRRPDIFLANSILNWSPIVNLQEGLLKTINYFKRKNI